MNLVGETAVTEPEEFLAMVVSSDSDISVGASGGAPTLLLLEGWIIVGSCDFLTWLSSCTSFPEM